MDDLGPVQTERLIRAYLDAGKYLEAMVVSKRAIAAFAPGLPYRVLLAEGFAALGKSERAVEALEAALKVDRHYLPALAMLAQVRRAKP